MCFAQSELKLNLKPIFRKSFEPSFEYYCTKKISVEVLPMIGAINPVKTATANYWFRPRYGIGGGMRYYWGKAQHKFNFYNGIITMYNTQTFGTKNQTVSRVEYFIGLNTGLKARLYRHWFLDCAFAFTPKRIKKYIDKTTNTSIKRYSTPYLSSNGDGDLDLSLPDWGVWSSLDNMAFSGNISISYRF